MTIDPYIKMMIIAAVLGCMLFDICITSKEGDRRSVRFICYIFASFIIMALC